MTNKPTPSYSLTTTILMRLSIALVKLMQRMFTHLSKWVPTSLRPNAHQHHKGSPSCAPSQAAVGLLNHAAVTHIQTSPKQSKLLCSLLLILESTTGMQLFTSSATLRPQEFGF